MITHHCYHVIITYQKSNLTNSLEDIDYNFKTEVFRDVIYLIINRSVPIYIYVYVYVRI